jgi:hypothetical protein
MKTEKKRGRNVRTERESKRKERGIELAMYADRS